MKAYYLLNDQIYNQVNLNLSFKFFRNINKDINKMAQLTLLLRKAKRSNDIKLDLSNRQIHFVPSDLYTLNKLQILDLSGNKIASLDQKINQLTALKVLDLSNNSIMDLPKQILQLQNLQALTLQGNPLTKKFQTLLNPKSGLDIKKALRKCFGLQSSKQQQTKAPSWLDSKQAMNDTKTFGRIVQMENKFKSQQKRVQQLQRQLDKMSVKQNRSNGKDSFQLDSESILEIKFNNLQVGPQISQGGFSTIHKGTYKGFEVAVKKNFNPKIDEQLLKEFSNEINMLAKYRHPNIVLLVGICSVPPNLAIVTQFIEGGSLYDLLHKKKKVLSKEDKKKIVRQVLSSIAFLHEHDIVHRDIKSHNFLVEQNLTTKLCDFGLARHRDALNQGSMQFSGTPIYMAPELFLKKSYDHSVDIFALGTLVYQIYTGDIPYYGLDAADIKDKILKDSSLKGDANISKEVLEVVNNCRSNNPGQRPQVIKLLGLNIW